MTKTSRLQVGILIALCAVVALIYWPVWQGQFVYDDIWYIVRNPFIHGRLSFISLFADARTAAAPASGLSTDVYRPLTTLWFWIDAHLWGPHTLPYHLENLCLHAINGCLLFLLLRRWMRNSTAALAGCVVFLLHPVQVQSVAWITQRSSLASTTCLLAALVFFLGDEPTPIGSARWIFGILAATAALLFRETPIVLPILFGVIVSTRAKSPWSRAWKDPNNRGALFALICLSVLYIAVREAVVGQWSQSPQSESWIGNIGLGVLAFPVYLGKILLPMKLRVSYSYPAPHPTHVALSLVVWIVYGEIVLYYLRRDRWMAAGLLWIGIGLLPVLQIIPIRAFVTERFLYLPMVGVAIVVCCLYSRPASRWLFVLWLLFLTLMTWRAVPAWRNEQSLWAEAVKQDSGNAFAHLCYGAALGDLPAAGDQYRQALRSHPTVDVHFAAVNNLANVLLHQGNDDEALVWARKAVDQKPDSAEALSNLVQASLRTGHRQESLSALGRLERLVGADAEPVRSLRREIANRPRATGR